MVKILKKAENICGVGLNNKNKFKSNQLYGKSLLLIKLEFFFSHFKNFKFVCAFIFEMINLKAKLRFIIQQNFNRN